MLKTLEDLHKPDPRHMPGAPLDAEIGMRVEVEFHEMEGGFTLPYFRPTAPG